MTAYPITVKNNKELTPQIIADIMRQRPSKDGYKIRLKNTRDISSKTLMELSKYGNIIFEVRGGMDYEKKDKYKRDKYYERMEYKPRELASIVSMFEGIESKIDPKWTQLEKAMFVYKTLAKGIKYDPNVDNQTFQEVIDTSNLRGMLTRISICSGYAMIYKEAMSRINIPSRYINNPGHHNWNAIKVNHHGKQMELNVDLTWDSNKYHTIGFSSFENFGQDPRVFYGKSSHNVDSQEYPLPQGMLTDKERKEILTTLEQQRVSKLKDKHITSIGQVDGLLLYSICQERQDGTLSNPKIFGCGVNLTSMNPRTGVPEIADIFSTIHKGKGTSKILFVEEGKPNKYNYQARSFRRTDGSSFALFTTGKKKFGEANQYTYVEFKKGAKGVEAYRTTLYSERDLINCDAKDEKAIANSLLTSDRVKEKSNTRGGYVGYIENNIKLINNALEKKIISSR
ncbi:MAG: hypothetical protein R3Y43_04955 [Alphaproteobacteria bacterium]